MYKERVIVVGLVDSKYSGVVVGSNGAGGIGIVEIRIFCVTRCERCVVVAALMKCDEKLLGRPAMYK